MQVRRGFKLFTAILLIVGMTGLLILVLVGGRDDPRLRNPPQRLPDGTLLTLLRIDYGATNIPVTDSMLLKMRRLYLPVAGVSLFGQEIVPALPRATNYGQPPAPEGELVFLIRFTMPTTNTPVVGAVRQVGVSKNLRAITFDENGNEIEAFPGSVLPSSRAATNEHIFVCRLPVFPRSGNLVGVRMLQQVGSNDWAKVAEFMTRNPCPGPYSQWTAEPQPVIRKVGDLEFTLSDLQAGRHPNGLTNARVLVDGLAAIAIKEDGKPSLDWRMVELVLSDATGNCWRPGYFRELKTNDHAVTYNFPSRLDARVPWKIGVEFAQKSTPATEGVLTFSGIKLHGGSFASTQATNWHGYRFSVALSDSPAFGQSKWMLLGQIFNADPSLKIRLKSLSDEKGNDVLSQAGVLRMGSSGNQAVIFLPLSAITNKSLTATYAIPVPKTVQVEFLAQPKVIVLPDKATQLPKTN